LRHVIKESMAAASEKASRSAFGNRDGKPPAVNPQNPKSENKDEKLREVIRNAKEIGEPPVVDESLFPKTQWACKMLGLTRWNTFKQADLTNRYKTLALILHPDKLGPLTPEDEFYDDSKLVFSWINEANSWLKHHLEEQKTGSCYNVSLFENRYTVKQNSQRTGMSRSY